MKRLLILGLSLISLAGLAQSNVDAGEQINRGFQKLGSGYRLYPVSDSAWLAKVKNGTLPLPQLDAKLNKADTSVFARKNVLSNYVALLMADKLNKVDTNVFVRKNVFASFQSSVTLNKLNVSDTSALARKTALAALQATFTTGLGTKEPLLSNPSADGYVLTSSATGARSWVSHPLAVRGTNNLFVGVRSGNSTLTGAGNVTMGADAGSGLTSGTDNIFVGRGAMSYMTTGSRNVVLGADAYVPNSANDNVLIGWGVGANGTGGNLVYIGSGSGAASGTQSNGVALGYGVLTGAGALNYFFTVNRDYRWLVGGYVDDLSTKMQVQGSVAMPTATKTASYSVGNADYTVKGNASTGAITLTLPSAVGLTGRIHILKKSDSSANAVTVATAGGLIDGNATYTLATQYKFLTVQSDGTNWNIIGNN